MGLREFLDSCGTPFRLPSIAETYAGRSLIVCGDAQCVWDDLAAFGAVDTNRLRGRVFKPGWDLMVVNKLGETFPGDIEHWYSNSADCLARFMPARRDEYAREFSPVAHAHALYEGPGIICWPFGGHGTSGLGACLTGLALGYDRIAICGMPLDDGPHNGEPPWRKTAFATSEAAGGQRTGRNSHWWKAKEIAFDGRVRSMSGRTREWLGDAREWLLPSPASSVPAASMAPTTSPSCATASPAI